MLLNISKTYFHTLRFPNYPFWRKGQGVRVKQDEKAEKLKKYYFAQVLKASRCWFENMVRFCCQLKGEDGAKGKPIKEYNSYEDRKIIFRPKS